MINAKVKIINDESSSSPGSNLEEEVNKFLKTIDVRQIIKTEYSSNISSGQYSTKRLSSVIIYYVGLDDIRDAKIDNTLEIK
jgi:hypothetical protein